MVNGTTALHILLISLGSMEGKEVITQALTFAATAASICHAGADPVFIDVEKETLGLDPDKLQLYLKENALYINGKCIDKKTEKIIAAVVPMHTFGHPARIDEIVQICNHFDIPVIEDAAESLGSYYKAKHTGIFGQAAFMSFNGNKTITTGGGGVVITQDDALAERVRYLSTTAKRSHKWEFYHDEVGYNYRMPNVNAAVGCAQMEYLSLVLKNKRETALLYHDFFKTQNKIIFFNEPEDCQSNYWLNVILLQNREERDYFLNYTNSNGVQTRPAWVILPKLPPYRMCLHGELSNAEWLEDRIVNIPSSFRIV
jgi:aminotransferase in exopolysaccharide biosynthesis